MSIEAIKGFFGCGSDRSNYRIALTVMGTAGLLSTTFFISTAILSMKEGNTSDKAISACFAFLSGIFTVVCYGTAAANYVREENVHINCCNGGYNSI